MAFHHFIHPSIHSCIILRSMDEWLGLVNHINNIQHELSNGQSRRDLTSFNDSKNNDLRAILRIVDSFANPVHDSAKSLCYLLVSRLLRQGFNTSQLVLVRGYSVALDIIRDSYSAHCHDSKRSLWSDSGYTLSLVGNLVVKYKVFQHLQFNSEERVALSKSILELFLDSALSKYDDSTIGEDTAHYVAIAGPSSSCTVMHNTLVMDISVPHQLNRLSTATCSDTGSQLVVALFDCSLELPSGEEASRSFDMTGPFYDDGEAPCLEYELLEGFARLLVRSRVTLLACQKRIHPYLQRILVVFSIACLPRVSIRYMSLLQRMSGARRLGSMPMCGGDEDSTSMTLDASSLGVLGSVRVEYIFGKKLVVARGLGIGRDDGMCSLPGDIGNTAISRILRVSTVVVTAVTDSFAVDARAAIEQIVVTLRRLLRDPFLVSREWFASLVRPLVEFRGDQESQSRTAQSVSLAVQMFGKCLQQSVNEAFGAEDMVLLRSDALSAIQAATKAVIELLGIEEFVVLSPKEE